MIRNLRTLASVALLSAAAVTAQTESRVSVVRPCTVAAPVDSLIPAAMDPFVVRMDANDFASIEIERAVPADGWTFEADSRRPGFSGSGYWRWTGPDLFSIPGRGVVAYRVFVNNPGTYQIRIHNRHDHPDASLENDCWMRVNGGNWTKTYSNTGSNVRVWNWHFRFDPGHGVVQYALNQGVNVIEISGRSRNFMIDRMHVYRSGFAGENISLPTTGLRWQRPVVGGDFDLLAGDPTGSLGLTPGSTTATLLLSDRLQAPCGTVIPGVGESLLGSHRLPDVFGAPVVLNRTNGAARFRLDIPNDRALVGVRVLGQAVLVDGNRVWLTNALRLRLGDV